MKERLEIEAIGLTGTEFDLSKALMAKGYHFLGVDSRSVD